MPFSPIGEKLESRKSLRLLIETAFSLPYPWIWGIRFYVSHRLAAGEEVLAVPEDLLQRLVFCVLGLGKQMVVRPPRSSLPHASGGPSPLEGPANRARA
jgi:hypothetical protein